jgi:putative ABC transport system permease protein
MKLPRRLRWRTKQELEDEIQSHLEIEIQANLERGLSRDEARYAALRRFGNRTRIEEGAREGDPLFGIETFGRDVLHGIRNLRRNPGFAVAATVSLALGIGANSLIFSILDSTLLKPLAFPEPGRLAVLWTVPLDDARQAQPASLSTFFEFRDRMTSFESVGAYNGGANCSQRTLSDEENGVPAERVTGQAFSPSLFRALGVKPLLGRTFRDDEDKVDDVANVAVLSYGTWQRRFGANPAIVGKTFTLSRSKTAVIGVMPPDFTFFGNQVELFMPLCVNSAQLISRVGGNTILGRLKPGVSLRAAQAEADTIAAQLAASDPARHAGLGARIEPLQQAAYGAYRLPLLILQGAVGFVLLIGCANVAGLLLARAASRRTEVAVRAALGAGRRRIVRQLMAESFPLFVLGGVAGLLLAWAGLKTFVAMAPPDFPRLAEISLNLRVLGFTSAVVLLTGILFAAAPAVQASKAGVEDTLKESGRGGTGGRARQRVRRVLVTGQIALAMMLLVGAGLMVNSFLHVQRHDLGADPSNLLTFDFHWPTTRAATSAGRYHGVGLWDVTPRAAQAFDTVLDRLRTIPGVMSAAGINLPVLNGSIFPLNTAFQIAGRPAPLPNPAVKGQQRADQTADYFAITPAFFATLRTPLLRGRDFNDRDTPDAPPVIIINQTLARLFFANEDPIGQRLTLDLAPNEQPREVIAVVGDTVTARLQREQAPAVYVPHVQQTPQFSGPAVYFRAGMFFVLRTSSAPGSLGSAVKHAVAEIDPTTPVSDLKTVEENLDQQVRSMRGYMFLLAGFGMVAVILAATGIYGVMSCSVAERTREIGIRMALGARSSDVLKMIFSQAGRVIGAGVAIGLSGAVALTGLIKSALYGITATDPATYAGVSLLLVLVALIACAIPTRRAVKVDPTITLRYE